MALIVVFNNVKQYSTNTADYTVTGSLNTRLLWKGTVSNHARDLGWMELLRDFVIQNAGKEDSLDGNKR